MTILSSESSLLVMILSFYLCYKSDPCNPTGGKPTEVYSWSISNLLSCTKMLRNMLFVVFPFPSHTEFSFFCVATHGMVHDIPIHPQVCPIPRQELVQVLIVSYDLNGVSYCTLTMLNVVSNLSLRLWSRCISSYYTRNVLLHFCHKCRLRSYAKKNQWWDFYEARGIFWKTTNYAWWNQ